MKLFQFLDLGEAWQGLLKTVYSNGIEFNNELRELKNISFEIKKIDEKSRILLEFANKDNINAMKHVYNDDVDNIFHHSYAKLIRGPKGLNDLSDIVEILQKNIGAKRASVVILSDPHSGKVPCIQCIHFIVRNSVLETTYFARAQDIYGKFYADVIAIYGLSKKVAAVLGISAGSISGFVSSLHIYNEHIDESGHLIEAMNHSTYVHER